MRGCVGSVVLLMVGNSGLTWMEGATMDVDASVVVVALEFVALGFCRGRGSTGSSAFGPSASEIPRRAVGVLRPE